MALPDMYLLIDGQKTGKIKGDSDDALHKDQICISDWSWGMTTSSSMGGMGGAVKTSLSEISFVKYVDTSSTALMSVMRNNETIKKGILTVRKPGGKPIDYFTISFERARISAYSVASKSGVELVEQISIAFEKVEIQHFSLDVNGGRGAGSTFMTEVTKT
jgi:type VI secretion system secreted protein Hcp